MRRRTGSQNRPALTYSPSIALSIALLLSLPTSIPGCERSSAPEDPELTAAIVSPHDGALVADTVRVIVHETGGRAPKRTTIFVDGSPRIALTQPPWRFDWITNLLADGSLHRLRAEVEDAAGHRCATPECEVRVRRNHTPVLTLEWPPDEHWIDLDRSPQSWSCRATDPDQGQVPDSMICWRVDGREIGARGATVAQPFLTEGEHAIELRATDEWGRSAVVRRSIHAFHYPPADRPEACLERFACALRARDSETASACLADEYRFPLPGASEPWPAATERDGIHRLLSREDLERIVLSAPQESVERCMCAGRSLAKIEMLRFSIDARLRCADSTAGTWKVDNAPQRVFFVRQSEAEGDEWRLLAWWDLRPAGSPPAGARTWSDLKSAALRNALCGD